MSSPYLDELILINKAVVLLMKHLHDQGGRGVELAEAIDHLGAARECLGGDWHTHSCAACGKDWVCTGDEDECDLTCPKCGQDSVAPTPVWVDKHSVNCYRCGAMVDERTCLPNTKEYGGNDDGGELCPTCAPQEKTDG